MNSYIATPQRDKIFGFTYVCHMTRTFISYCESATQSECNSQADIQLFILIGINYSNFFVVNTTEHFWQCHWWRFCRMTLSHIPVELLSWHKMSFCRPFSSAQHTRQCQSRAWKVMRTLCIFFHLALAGYNGAWNLCPIIPGRACLDWPTRRVDHHYHRALPQQLHRRSS